MKYRMYVDESGNSDMGSCDDQNHRFLCLCGIIMEHEYINDYFQKDFEKFKKKHFGYNADSPIILHRHDIINFNHPFEILKDSQKETNFNKDLLKKLSEWNYTIIAVMIDKKLHNDTYHYWKEHPYHYCLQVLMEKYASFLRGNSSVGDVFIESRNSRDDKLLKGVFNNIYVNGTRYVTGEDVRQFLTSKEINIKPKQMNIAGLQIADLIAQPIRNKMIDKHLHKKRLKDVFGDHIIDENINKIYNNCGKFWGYGLKVLP